MQLLAGKRDLGNDQNTGCELHSNSWLFQEWQENCGRNRLWWNGDGSSVGIMWILSTCYPTESHWSIPDSTRWCAKETIQEEGWFSRTENLEVCKGRSGELLAWEFHQSREQMIHIICAAIEIQVYRAEKVTTTKQRHIQVPLNRSWQAATKWSYADRQSAEEQLEREIHRVTLAKSKLFDKLFQHHKRQLLQEVVTEPTSPRCTFANDVGTMESAAAEEVYGAANMTTDKSVEFRVCLFDGETESNPQVSLIWTELQISCRVTFMVSLRMSRCVSRWNWSSIQGLVAGNWDSATPENHRTACDTFRIPNNASCEPYNNVNSANVFQWQSHHSNFGTTTYRQRDRGITIYR